MERAEWLKQMRSMSEALYDYISPAYWGRFGLYPNETHQEYLQKFLALVEKGGPILSAACGAGRYDGFLLEAGHSVTGIDQSAGMLKRAREHYPQVTYQKIGLQELDFHEAFDGVICMDAMEHICPEDWPGVIQRFAAALKPGGMLYLTVEPPDEEEVRTSYERSKAMGLPVVFGELADQVEASFQRVQASGQKFTGEQTDLAVYHYYPSPEQVQDWLGQAGLVVEAEGIGNGYRHLIARKHRRKSRREFQHE